VIAAVDGASSSSQKLAARATTTAIQMRIPKAQALTETPAKRKGRRVVAVVIGSPSCGDGERPPPWHF
jgi:hypothetical protein